MKTKDQLKDEENSRFYTFASIGVAWILTVFAAVFYSNQLTLANVDAKISRAQKQLKTCHAILVGDSNMREE